MTSRNALHSAFLSPTIWNVDVTRPCYMVLEPLMICSDGTSVLLGRDTWPCPSLQRALLFSPHLITCKRCTVYNSYWPILGYFHDLNWRASEGYPHGLASRADGYAQVSPLPSPLAPTHSYSQVPAAGRAGCGPGACQPPLIDGDTHPRGCR